MAIALTVYPNDLAASATLSTANVLIGNATINAGGAGHGSTVGIATGFDECFSQGKGAAWAAASVNTSIAPTGHGWFLDASTLDGLDIVAGNWTAAWSLNVTANTATVDLYTRVFTYLSGAYTQIGYILQSGAALTSTLTTYTSGATSLPAIHFATGTKLYIDLWANVTASTMIAGSVINVRQSNLAGDGLSTCNTITPGYVLALSTSMTAAGVLSVTMGYKTALASTDSGVGTLVGTLLANETLSGTTLVGVGTFTPTLSLQGAALSSTLAGTGTLAETFSLATALTSTAAGTGTLSGTLSAATPLALSVTLPGSGTLTAALAMLILASDTFVRANQANWGQSSGVGSWVKGNGTSTASIASNKGLLTGATNVTTEYIGTTSAADVDLKVRFIQSAATAASGLIARGVVAASNYYAAWLKNGSLTINSVAAGTFTAFATTAFTATAGSAYWIRYRLTGTTHMLKVWTDGSAEPIAWQLTATDSTYAAAGQFGLVAQQALVGDTVQFDSFTAQLAGWSTPLPAPIYFGAYEPPSYTSTAGIATFETLIGTTMSIVHGYCQWGAGTSTFSTTWANTIRTHGSIPMLTWEPWDLVGPTNAAYTLANITAGNFDTYITTFANAIKAWGFPLFLRFAHEMNGIAWYPWQEGSNGNSVGQYVPMWKHVHDIFTAQGVTNVTWVWCPNDEGGGSYPITGLYPGDAYVDWTGIDGYNASGGQTFGQIYTPIYNDLVALTTKPIMIAEFGTEEEAAGVKGSWYYDMLRVQLPYFFPKIRAIAVFDSTYGTHTTIPINSSTDATNQFSSAITTSGYYVGNSQGSLATTPIPPFGTAPVTTNFIPRALSALLLTTTTLSQTLAGVGQLSGSLSAQQALSALTLVGNSTLSGASLTEATALASTLVGAGQLSASGQLTTALVNTLVGTSQLSGSVLEMTALTSALIGVGQLSSSLTAVTSLTVTLAGVGTLAGTFSSGGALTVVVAGVGQLSAILSATYALNGPALSGVTSISGSLTATFSMSGATTAGNGTLAGTLQLATALALTTSGVGQLSGLAALSAQLTSGVLVGSSALSGAPSLRTQLAAALSGVGISASVLSAALALSSATLVGVGTLSGIENLTTALTDSFTGTSTLTGSLTAMTPLTATLAGSGTLTGAISGGGTLAVVGVGAGTLTGSLAAALSMSGGTAVGTGTLTGALTARAALTSSLSGIGSSAATPSLGVAWTGVLVGVGTLSGTSILSTSLLVIVPGASSLGGTLIRTAMLMMVYTGVSQLSASLILGGGQLSMCLFAGRGMLVGVFSFPGKSVTATWQTRDLSTTWQTRDLAATWQTRDLEDTWKERR